MSFFRIFSILCQKTFATHTVISFLVDFGVILPFHGGVHKTAEKTNTTNAKKIETLWTVETLSVVPPGRIVRSRWAGDAFCTMPACVL